MNDKCIGCASITSEVGCTVVEHNDEDICPCGECIIKSMCYIGCEEMAKMYNSLRKRKLDVAKNKTRRRV